MLKSRKKILMEKIRGYMWRDTDVHRGKMVHGVLED